jgi:hypothetical protein
MSSTNLVNDHTLVSSLLRALMLLLSEILAIRLRDMPTRRGDITVKPTDAVNR